VGHNVTNLVRIVTFQLLQNPDNGGMGQCIFQALQGPGEMVLYQRDGIFVRDLPFLKPLYNGADAAGTLSSDQLLYCLDAYSFIVRPQQDFTGLCRPERGPGKSGKIFSIEALCQSTLPKGVQHPLDAPRGGHFHPQQEIQIRMSRNQTGQGQDVLYLRLVQVLKTLLKGLSGQRVLARIQAEAGSLQGQGEGVRLFKGITMGIK
jgi:hypothetical protein